MMKKRWLSLSLAAALMTGGTFSPAQALQRGGVVKIISLGEPQLLNPVFENSASTKELYNLIYSGLIRFDSFSNMRPDLIQYVPTFKNGGVAVEPDGSMVVTYDLRENLKWHDGHPLTAEDIQFTWQVHSDPRIKYPPTPGYETIKHVEVINETRAKVYFHRVYPNYYKLFQYVLPKHSFRSQYWTFSPEHPYNQHPVGSGPFVLVDWEKGKRAVLNANLNYHFSPPYLDQIRYSFKPDDYTAFSQALDWSQEADVVQGMSVVSYENIKNRKDLQVHVVPLPQVEHLTFNVNNPILASQQVRRAIALAIDHKKVQEILLGLGEPAFGDQHKESWRYNPQVESYYGYNPKHASDMLGKAGWRLMSGKKRMNWDGKPLELELTFAKGNKTHSLLAKYLQNTLRDVGVVLTLKAVTPEQLVHQTLPEGNYDMAFATWNTRMEDSSFKRWHSSQVPPKGMNYSRLSDYQVDRLLGQLDKTFDIAHQKRLYHELSNTIAEQMPAVPLFYNTKIVVSKPYLHNYRPNPYIGNTWNSHEWWRE